MSRKPPASDRAPPLRLICLPFGSSRHSSTAVPRRRYGAAIDAGLLNALRIGAGGRLVRIRRADHEGVPPSLANPEG